MNATSRDLPGRAMDDTIAYQPEPTPDPRGSGHVEANEMPDPASKGQHRYFYGSGARPLEGYTIKRAIGRGGFGEVYYATSDAGKEVALKLITRNLDVERRGVQQCMNLKSPHLITIFDLKSNDLGDSFVIMEYVSGPSLANILRDHPNGLPPAEVRHWLKGLVEGVSYLHDHGIVHRDLKPANLFLEEGVVKIGDYGLSKAITTSQEPGHSESVGTCHYMAPEIGSGKYHKPIDIYAIGVILYEMITGRVPFDGETVQEVLMKHLTSRPDLTPIAEPYRSIISRSLAKDPNARPSRAIEMLPPGDAPDQPQVRFIGDGKNAPNPGGAPNAPAGGATEEVMRIEAEEPVFYIGPDTMPPGRARQQRPRRGYERWFGARTARRAAPSPNPAARQRAYRRPAPTPPPLPPEPPPLPSGRVRMAELATSMLSATPLAVLGSILSLPMFGPLGVDVPQDPLQLAYLFGLLLLGVWGLLVPAKVLEGKQADNSLRRLVNLAVGMGLGSAGVAIAEWSHLREAPVWKSDGFNPELVSWVQPLGAPATLQAIGFATYFALVFGALGWWQLCARDRGNRFAFWPVVKAGAVAAAIGLFWPSPQPWASLLVALIAVLLQVVSPWNRQAAEYAQAVRRYRRVA